MLSMSKTLKIVFISLFLLTSIYANEEMKQSFFMGADFGVANDVAKNACKSDEDKTLFGTLKAGYNLNSKPVRVYFSFSPIKWDYAKADLIELSGDYIYNLNKKFSLFGGVSIGYTNLKGDFSGKEDKGNYGFQAGVIYKLTSKIDLEVGYKYINSNNIKAQKNQNFISLDNFNICNFGVSYKF